MSDSGSDAKVEDVLSSVRRLISSELPRTPRADVPIDDKKLVLTQSQRIEPEEEITPVRPEPGAPGSRPMSLEDRIAELEAAVSAQPDEWEPDGSEDQTQHVPDHMIMRPEPSPKDDSQQRGPLRLSQIALVDAGELDGEDAGVDSVEPTLTFKHESPDREGQTAKGENEPEGIPADMPQDSDDISADPGGIEAALDREFGLVDDVASSLSEPTDQSEAAVVVDLPVVEEKVTIPGLEEPSQEFEKHDAEPEPETTTDVPQDASAVTPMPDETVLNDEETAKGLALNEDVLTEFVSSLIRKELHGDLGERITRNVRKLVRQEIQRALAARDFD